MVRHWYPSAPLVGEECLLQGWGLAMLEIWLVLNRRRRGPLDLWEVPKPSVPPVAEAASARGSETVLVLVALTTTKSAVNEQYTNFFFKTTNVSHT